MQISTCNEFHKCGNYTNNEETCIICFTGCLWYVQLKLEPLITMIPDKVNIHMILYIYF